MGLIYKISDKELLKIRNKIFLEKGIPALEKNGFVQSPFSTAWFGKNNLGDYTYELCRRSKESYLEMIVTHISRGDRWIQVFLNIFELQPKLKSISELQGLNGVKYHIPPNSQTKMELRCDDIKVIPLLSYNFWFRRHKIRWYFTKAGFDKRIHQLEKRIEQDMTNIDSFVNRWHELHKPNVVDWEGNKI